MEDRQDPAVLIERLFPRLEWRGDCLEATGRSVPRRYAYGQVNYEGRYYRATRFIWAAVHGWESIDGLMLRHTCDNPPCCNIDHLTPGTSADNARDRMERGRQRVHTG